ncbi:MAG: helix-turn-helix domain-containing protein [Vicinamibacterales bacterium]
MARRSFFTSAQKRTAARAAAGTESRHGFAAEGRPSSPALDVALIDVPEAARRLGIPVKSVYDCIYHHHLPTRRVGRLIRIHPGELDAWTRASREGATSTPRLVSVK